MIVANLEMDSYNELYKRDHNCITESIAFMQNVVKLSPLIQPCMILGVSLFLVYDG